MILIDYKDFYQISGVKQHREFDEFLRKILFIKDERETFYKKLIALNSSMSVDTFKPYFELYLAERKSNQQDYTPDSVATILSSITRSEGTTALDPTGGTGTLVISKWYDDLIQESVFTYAPHRYHYHVEELADNAIPYLIHNCAMRGMNVTIVHGDVITREVKQIYFIQNSADDFLGFSDVNVMPHSEQVSEFFNVKEWVEDEMKYIESKEVTLRYSLPMKKERIKSYVPPGKPKPRTPKKNTVLLKDVAILERARKGVKYPEGTVVVQLSATKGQIGLLKSFGEVEAHYACVNFNPVYMHPEYGFHLLKAKMPKYLHRVKEGLNMTFESLQNMPVYVPPLEEQLKIIEEDSGQFAFKF